MYSHVNERCTQRLAQPVKKREAFAHDAYLKPFVSNLGIWHAKFFACGFAGCTEKKPVKIGGSFSLNCVVAFA